MGYFRINIVTFFWFVNVFIFDWDVNIFQALAAEYDLLRLIFRLYYSITELQFLVD